MIVSSNKQYDPHYKPAKDLQRKKVYDWEDAVIEGFRTSPVMTLEESQQFADKALRWWFRGTAGPTRWSMTPIKVQHKANIHSNATANHYTIMLPDWAKRKAIILHEVAHTIVARHNLLYYDGGHGPYFVRIFVSLLGHFFKQDQAHLKRTLRVHKIKIKLLTDIDRPKREGK